MPKKFWQYLTQDINLSEEEDKIFLQLDWIAGLLKWELELKNSNCWY